MELQIDNYIGNKLVLYLGSSRSSWVNFFSNLTIFNLEVDNYFLDIFLPISDNQIPKSIRLSLALKESWLAIHYLQNLHEKILVEVKSQLYSKLH